MNLTDYCLSTPAGLHDTVLLSRLTLSKLVFAGIFTENTMLVTVLVSTVFGMTLFYLFIYLYTTMIPQRLKRIDPSRHMTSIQTSHQRRCNLMSQLCMPDGMILKKMSKRKSKKLRRTTHTLYKPMVIKALTVLVGRLSLSIGWEMVLNGD